MILYTTAASSLEVEREILLKLSDSFQKFGLKEVEPGKNVYSIVIIVEEQHEGN